MVALNRLPFRFMPEARQEFREQIEWYRAQSTDAASAFLRAMRSSVEQIITMPEIHAPYLHQTRKASVGPFPVRIVFQARRGVIEIVAVAHAKRKPGYWRERLGD